MNERVIELYKQAAEFAYTTAGTDAGKGTIIESLTAGKFAELIVQECADVVIMLRKKYDTHRDVDVTSGTEHWQDYVDVLLTAEVTIKEHFGVEL